MVVITFPSRDIEKRGLGFLIGRFSSSVLKTGEHIVPEAALEALGAEGIPFTFQKKITHDEQMAALRSAVSSTIQQRPRRTAQMASGSRTRDRRTVRRS